jgi:hypothetical protein
MARMPNPRVLAEVLRSGNVRARLRAAREGLTGVRLQLVAAALGLGLLDALGEGPADTEQLAGRLGAVDHALLAAYLRVLAAAGLITGEGSWRLTRFGRAVVDDDVVRATYQGFGGYHTELYRDLPALLRGGPGRRDTVESGEVIARLSAAIYPLIRHLLVRTVTTRRPRRVLDIGCGAGLHLAAMLEAAPGATGVGVEVDPDAAALARRTLSERGLADRASVRLSPPGARTPSPTTSTWPCSPTASTTCRSTSGWSCCAQSPACSHPAAPSWSSPPWRGRSCSAGTWTWSYGRRKAAWSCPPSTCCSVSSARRAWSRTPRSASAPPSLRSAR